MCSFAPQTQSRRIDEMYRLADLASQAATGLRDQMSEQRAECLARALGIGVGEGRARYRPSSEVGRCAWLARPASISRRLCAPANCPYKRAMNWSQPAHPRIGPVRIHQPIEHMPWHVLQDSVEYAILMPHGVDLLPCPDTLPDVRRTEESTPCALSTKTQPDSRGVGKTATVVAMAEALAA